MNHLIKLYLRNFRSYREAVIDCSPEVNAFYGSNAQGKTNLLEAIFLLSTGKSFRTLHLKELIREGESFFYIEALFKKDGIEQTLKLSFDGQARKLEYNQTTHHSFTPLFGVLPSVLFAPEDALLVAGAPGDRRRFFDLHLAQLDPLYVYHLGRYFQALKQRNHLLKQKQIDGIEIWEKMLGISASYLTGCRERMIEELQPLSAEILGIISNSKDELKLRYVPTVSGKRNYEEAYAANRSRELQIGSTFIGPHRDDFTIMIEGRDAKSYASEGQKLCAAAALKMGQWKHLKNHNGQPPLFAADDLGVHLDRERAKRLETLLGSLGQVFITSPEPPSFQPARLFEISASTVQVFQVGRS